MGLQQTQVTFDTLDREDKGQVRVTVNVFDAENPAVWPDVDVVVTDLDGDIVVLSLEDFRRVAKIVETSVGY
jgi:hypothetical protein